ncbi:MAG: hypothetical protein KDA28_03885, partial [Phycisphaerales bacterium]|nr:hypothetical protein [Phycisphaerales bacterium]
QPHREAVCSMQLEHARLAIIHVSTIQPFPIEAEALKASLERTLDSLPKVSIVEVPNTDAAPGELDAVKLGRELDVRAVVVVTAKRVGDRLYLIPSVHDVRNGEKLATTVMSSAGVEDLLAESRRKIGHNLTRIQIVRNRNAAQMTDRLRVFLAAHEGKGVTCTITESGEHRDATEVLKARVADLGLTSGSDIRVRGTVTSEDSGEANATMSLEVDGRTYDETVTLKLEGDPDEARAQAAVEALDRLMIKAAG